MAAAASGGRALMTGATTGIGRALATCFARGGYALVLVARHQDALVQAADELRRSYRGCVVDVVPTDLSVSSAAPALAAHLQQRNLAIDVLVNNAGFGARGPFAFLEWRQQQEMLFLNIIALTELTARLLPGMVQRRAGRILNVASTAAFQPGPLMAVYYSCRLSFSSAVRVRTRRPFSCFPDTRLMG